MYPDWRGYYLSKVRVFANTPGSRVGDAAGRLTRPSASADAWYLGRLAFAEQPNLPLGRASVAPREGLVGLSEFRRLRLHRSRKIYWKIPR